MPNQMANKVDLELCCHLWDSLPDDLLWIIFHNLKARPLLRTSQVCRHWRRVALDEYLWKDLFQQRWKIESARLNMPVRAGARAGARGRGSWLAEFKRLHHHTPLVQSEVLEEHRDQVLHVCFSHDGSVFATCSKDGFVKVWNAGYPASVKYYADMKDYTWKYTQFSQFNESDTLLLVSGVHFGSQNTGGEITVFSLTDDQFELQCRVANTPYDIFGTWFSDNYLLSGNIHRRGHLTSCSVVWLNKASQALDSELESVVMPLYKFLNVNASSVRTIMVANRKNPPQGCTLGLPCPATDGATSQEESTTRKRALSLGDKVSVTECRQAKCHLKPGHGAKKIQMFRDGGNRPIQLIEVDDLSSELGKLSGTIEYDPEYRQAECHSSDSDSDSSERDADLDLVDDDDETLCDSAPCDNNPSGSRTSGLTRDLKQSPLGRDAAARDPMGRSSEGTSPGGCDTVTSYRYTQYRTEPRLSAPEARRGAGPCRCGEERLDRDGGPLCDFCRRRHAEVCPTCSEAGPPVDATDLVTDKYLIFTMGTKTYTPHQIGIKRITSEEALMKMHSMYGWPRRVRRARAAAMGTGAGAGAGADDAAHPPQEGDEQEDPEEEDPEEKFDQVDHVIELHGHIIGMSLSPDHRYLYVNNRPWPRGYVIDDPLYPPPIAQEIDIHVIDLATMQEVGTMHRAHKAYTPNDECFFIFLDVCDEYVASGAEDKHGYLWDRHYGVCLTRYEHQDVVNCVAFNPRDRETLITVSDDHKVKIWRSRNRVRQLERRHGVQQGVRETQTELHC